MRAFSAARSLASPAPRVDFAYDHIQITLKCPLMLSQYTVCLDLGQGVTRIARIVSLHFSIGMVAARHSVAGSS